MKLLRRFVDRSRKLYHAPDAPLHKLWPLFDANETFLFAPATKTPKRGPHVRDYVDLKRVMWTVILALIPCLAWAIYNAGAQHFRALASLDGTAPYVAGWLQGLVFGGDYQPAAAAATFADKVVFGLQKMLPILLVSYGVGLSIEVFFAILRNEEVSEGYLVSGILIALIVPASIPLWQLALAVAFAVVLVKEVFGGTGMNIFNVALMARAFLFFAFAAQMSGDAVWVAGNGGWGLIDGYSAATPLAIVKPGTVLDASARLAEHHSYGDLFLGMIPGSAGEMSKLAVLLGAFWLIVTGVGSWRTMAGGVLGLLGCSLLMRWILPAGYGGPITLAPWEHLLVGGFAFGIVFMATDPVTSPETERGKWIYGILIGCVTILVRTINPAYPEGTMLAILLLNAFAPTIDHFIVAGNIRRRKLRHERQ